MSAALPVNAWLGVADKDRSQFVRHPGSLVATHTQQREIIVRFESELDQVVEFLLSLRDAFLLIRAVHEQIKAAQDPEQNFRRGAQPLREVA